MREPLTFQAIIIWRDELNEGKAFLRDIIDLEATHAATDAKAPPAPVAIGPAGQPVLPQPGEPIIGVQLPRTPATAPATPFKPAGERADGEETAADGTISESNLVDDDDDMENWLSVAAIEAELKPKLIETFDIVAGTYKRLRRLQDQDIQFQLKRLSLSPAQERKYEKLKNEIVGELKSLRLTQARIDALVEQLYDINKRLVGSEGSLMRLAESHGVVCRSCSLGAHSAHLRALRPQCLGNVAPAQHASAHIAAHSGETLPKLIIPTIARKIRQYWTIRGRGDQPASLVIS